MLLKVRNTLNYGVDNITVQSHLNFFFKDQISLIIDDYKSKNNGASPSTNYISEKIGNLSEEAFYNWLKFSMSFDEESAKEMRQASIRNISGYDQFYVSSKNPIQRSFFQLMKLGTVHMIRLTKFADINSKELSNTSELQLNALSTLGNLLIDWKSASQLNNKTEMSQIELRIVNFSKQNPVAVHALLSGAIFAGSDNIRNAIFAHYSSNLTNREFADLLYSSLNYVNVFASNPSKFISGYSFVNSTHSVDFSKDINQKAISEEQRFPHYHQQDREYAEGWIADVKKSLSDGITTLALDIADYGEKNGLTDAEIVAMGSFAGLNKSSGKWTVNKSNVNFLVSDIISKNNLNTPQGSDAYVRIVNSKEFKDALRKMTDSDGKPLFSEDFIKNFVSNTSLKNRGTEAGAEASYLMNYMLALSSMGLNWQFVLGDFFKMVGGLRNTPRSPMFNATTAEGLELLKKHFSRDNLTKAQIEKCPKFFSEGTATHENPLLLSLLENNRYNEISFALKNNLDVLKIIYGYTGEKLPLVVDESSNYAHIAGEPQVSLTVFYPSMASDIVESENSINKFVQFVLKDAEKRKENGTFAGVFEKSLNELLAIVDTKYVKYENGKKDVLDVEQDGYTTFYELNPQKHADFLKWLQSRKINGHEDPTHASYNYLTNGRFNGVGANILRRIELELINLPPLVSDSNADVNSTTLRGKPIVIDYDVSSISIQPSKEISSKSKDAKINFKLYSPFDAQSPGKLIAVPNLFSFDSNSLTINTGALPLSEPLMDELTSAVAIEIPTPVGATSGAKNVLHTFDVDLDLVQLYEYHLFTHAIEESENGNFRVSAGEDLSDYISVEMQQKNAGAKIQIHDFLDLHLKVQIVSAGQVEFKISNFKSEKKYSSGYDSKAINLKSTPVYEDDLIIEVGSGKTKQKVRILQANVISDLTRGNFSRGILYANVVDNPLQEPPHSQVSSIQRASVNGEHTIEFSDLTAGTEGISDRPVHAFGVGYAYDDQIAQSDPTGGRSLSAHRFFLASKNEKYQKELILGPQINRLTSPSEIYDNIFNTQKTHKILDGSVVAGTATFKFSETLHRWELVDVSMNKEYLNSLLLDGNQNNVFSAIPSDNSTRIDVSNAGVFNNQFFFVGQESEKVIKTACVRKMKDGSYQMTNDVVLPNLPVSVSAIAIDRSSSPITISSAGSDKNSIIINDAFYLASKSMSNDEKLTCEISNTGSLTSEKLFVDLKLNNEKVGTARYEKNENGDFELSNVSLNEEFRKNINVSYPDCAISTVSDEQGGINCDGFSNSYDSLYTFIGPSTDQLNQYVLTKKELEESLIYLSPVEILIGNQTYRFVSEEYAESTKTSPKRKLFFNGLHVFDLVLVDDKWELTATRSPDGLKYSADFENFVVFARGKLADQEKVLDSTPSR